jgi:hypothetical protein
MQSSIVKWLWLIAFVVAAYFVWKHWAQPLLPGA